MKRIIFYGILIFVFSIGIGYYFSVLWKSEKQEMAYEKNENEIQVEETIAVEEKISFDANLGLKKYYNNCGHTKYQIAELPPELVNLTKSEVEDLYSDWNVEEFSSDNLLLSQTINDICDEHYVIKLGDENIEVYHVRSSGIEELYKTTNISKEYLTSTDINNLERGIYVYGVSNLNSVIEDFE